jgi:hypothetical protein
MKMEQEQLHKLRVWFDSYVAGFYGDDEFVNANIELKDKHSRKVCEETTWLAGKLGLDDNQKRIAEAVALLHDVGRFEQFKKYRTYSDARSCNHSALGVEVICAERVLDGIDERERGYIEAAVKYHGDKELPQGLDANTLLYCRLIRDADKIDIYRVVTEYYEQYRHDPESFKLEIELPDEPWYSNEVVQKVLDGERIDYRLLKTWNDCKLIQLSWVYDVNFAATLERIRQRGFLEKLIEYLPKNDDINRVRAKVFEYVNSRIAEGS